MSKKSGASPKAISPINASSQHLYAHKGARTSQGVIPKLSGGSTKAGKGRPNMHPDESAKMAKTAGKEVNVRAHKGCSR